jgi:nicotinate dehydrogenase large molybdopterin subunit
MRTRSSEPSAPVEARVRPEYRVVGRSLTHRDFEEKVRGTLSYADDWQMPGMLYGKIVRAQVPSARIVGIDVEAAASIPGVRAVALAEHLGHNAISEEASGLGMEQVVMPVLASDRVRYQGEPIAVVAADTPQLAEMAAERVIVEYEESPGVFDPFTALEPDAPRVHGDGNLHVSWSIRTGDADADLASAPIQVEGTYQSQHVDHAYLEPEAGVGWIDGDGVLTLRVSTQVIEHAREVARILGLPITKVRVIGSYMGGGFGGKEDMTLEPYLALLAWRTRRPVKMVWSRQESLLARPKRHPFTMRYRTGATVDGRILAQKVEITGDAGAYPLLSARVLFAAAVTAAGPYRVPAAEITSRAVFTNNVPTSAMRGFGAMQVTFAYESQMDRLAEATGLTTTEIRRINFLHQGDRIPTGEALETYPALEEVMDTAMNAMGPRGEPVDPTKRRGRGFAVNMQPYGRTVFFGDHASAWVGYELDGSVTVRTGATDLGGGQAASLAQIAAEVLGVDVDRVSVHIADTALTPLAGGTFATRQLYMSGNAVLQTSRELRDRVDPVARSLLGVGPDVGLVFAAGRVAVEDGPQALSMVELVRECEGRGVDPACLSTFRPPRGEFDPRTGQGQTFPDYTYGAHAVDVEIDMETGRIEVQRYVACHDVGRAINPQRVEGQIQGGAVQGLGYALTEKVVLEEGNNLSSLFADYLILTAKDVPDIEAIVLEIAEGKGPFGARGIGEAPVGPTAAAIASAVHDALGVRLEELPMTPERVLRAMGSLGPAAGEAP